MTIRSRLPANSSTPVAAGVAGCEGVTGTLHALNQTINMTHPSLRIFSALCSKQAT
jgi:hypothetical protein